MADLPKWPPGLPTPLVEGVSYTPQDNVIRSPFPGGMKARRRATRANEDVTFRLLVSRAGMQMLQDFAAMTCADVLPFQWVEFRDPRKHPAVYVFKQRPAFTPIMGSLWYADLRLELRTPFAGTFPLDDDMGHNLLTDDDEGLTT